ncbi:MAG: polysaccharide biosynthesis protein [Ruminococcaceae bacterium]|nr:polysaccharide biosynthesis protein [Oscillospiraceae bacterium]
MTAVTLAVRYVSVAFNVYLTNKIGAVAMGLFTLISSVYGFALTLATSGLSLATTKLVSEALGGLEEKRKSSTVKAIMRKSLTFAFFISLAVSIGLYLLAPFLANNVLKDMRTLNALKILSYTLIPIALSSSMSGYFIAVRKVHKNATVQVFGHAVKIFSCIYLLSITTVTDVESACLAIIWGGSIAELFSFAIHLLSYVLDIKKEKSQESANNSLAKKFIPFTLPVAFSAYVRSALVTVEHLLIPWGLEKSGSGRNASLAAYGTIHSIVFPFVLFPSAISSSFAGLLVPEISESVASCDTERIERIISKVLKTVLIYSIGVAGIMSCLSTEFGNVFFEDQNAIKYLIFVAPLVPIMYLDTSVDSILKGLGHQFYCMIINIVDALLSVILVWILLPRYGIMGYIITVYFTEMINATLSITKLLCVTGVKFKIFAWVGKPIISIIASTALTRFILYKFNSFAQNKFEIIIHIIIVTGIYFLFLLVSKSISLKQIKRSVINFIKA